MATTLNQVIARIRTLALSHSQVNDFYFGEAADFDTKGGAGDVSYPAVFLELVSGQIVRADHRTNYTFRILVADKEAVSHHAGENTTEVLSDTASILQDIIALMMDPTYNGSWEIGEQINMAHFTEDMGDYVAGFMAEVVVGVDFLADRCQVPSSEVSDETDFDMARTKIVTYTGTGAEGASFAVTGLAGATVLAAYRAGSYKRAITTTPTDSDKIKVTGTDLGSNKGIYSSDGTVGLQSGDALLSGEVLDFIIWSL